MIEDDLRGNKIFYQRKKQQQQNNNKILTLIYQNAMQLNEGLTTEIINLNKNKTWSSVSNSTMVLPFIPYPFSLITYPLSLIPCSLSPITVPFTKFRWGLLWLWLLSQLQLNFNSTQELGVTQKWLYTTTTHHTNSMSAISQLFLTRF